MSKLSELSSQDSEEIIIFGAGVAGQRVFNNLQNEQNIVGFADNDVRKQTSEFLGLPVYSLQQIKNFDGKIIIASEFYEQIRKTLIEQTTINPNRIEQATSSLMASTQFSEQQYEGNTILRIVCEHLNRAKIDYHIDAGTLLGLYRDGALIPWDDDLDISLNSTKISRFLSVKSLISNDLAEQTKETWNVTEYYTNAAFGNVPMGAVRSLKFSSISNPEMPSIDVFIKYRCEEFSDYCLASRGIRMPARFSDLTIEACLSDICVRIPENTENYLEYHYGKDWRVPNPDWCLQDLNNTIIFLS